jgi:hypothetical protein
MARFPQLADKLSIRSRQSKRASESRESIDIASKDFDPRLAARFSFINDSEKTPDYVPNSSTTETRDLIPNNYDEKRPTSTIYVENLLMQESRKRSSFASSRLTRSQSPSRRRSIMSTDWAFNDPKRRSLNDLMCDAVSAGDVPQVGRLLGAGANPKRKSKDGLSPVHLAAAGGHLSVLKSLVMHGARLDVTDTLGRTALHIAVITRHSSVIPFLVSHGVPLDTRDEDGCTAAQLAIQQSTEELPITFGSEETTQEKVRFSYVFGQPEATKRASVSSVRSVNTTPYEALVQAGVLAPGIGNDGIASVDFATKASDLRRTD